MEYNPAVFQAVVLAKALDLYARTGLQANRAYTPKAMLATAERITGHKFHGRRYAEAADTLRTWAETQPG